MQSALEVAISPQNLSQNQNGVSKDENICNLIEDSNNESKQTTNILQPIWNENSEIDLIISKPKSTIPEDQENLFSSIISYESMGSTNNNRSSEDILNVSNRDTLISMLDKAAAEKNIQPAKESMFKNFLMWLSPSLQKLSCNQNK